ncbi:hypothetical protein GWK47_046176 [Chionoecetes opilio]|uniref:SWIM-type domain-containing protein n=1 Tax=Chionoecetes opilio TaxID=41210 RepID=A0A8J4Y4Z8_CHIOP|nr:hypothetical protein GWK47_046176 [Chionoecetes opilio]
MRHVHVWTVKTGIRVVFIFTQQTGIRVVFIFTQQTGIRVVFIFTQQTGIRVVFIFTQQTGIRVVFIFTQQTGIRVVLIFTQTNWDQSSLDLHPTNWHQSSLDLHPTNWHQSSLDLHPTNWHQSRGHRYGTYEGKSTAMAEYRVVLREIDIPGAILPCSVLVDNTREDLRRWLICRGFSTRKTESQQNLIQSNTTSTFRRCSTGMTWVEAGMTGRAKGSRQRFGQPCARCVVSVRRTGPTKYQFGSTKQSDETHRALSSNLNRVQDLTNSGMARYVCDPDGDVTAKYISAIAPPHTPGSVPDQWTHDLSCVPTTFSYGCIVNYLLRRKVKSLQPGSGDEESSTVCLPVAQKPLRRGYNFFASGHVDKIRANSTGMVVHTAAKVLSSFKEKVYDTTVAIEKAKGLIVHAGCKCVAGRGGKCNHVAGLLFALLDFRHSLLNAPESCTSNSQQWHKPPRRAKRCTRPTLAGRRKLEKHEYGRTPKRKRALEGFQEYDVLQVPTSDPSQQHRGLMTDFKKIKEDNPDAGILQVLDSSTTSASENDVPRPSTTAITLTPDERWWNKGCKNGGKDNPGPPVVPPLVPG